jgi:hypothetical protein
VVEIVSKARFNTYGEVNTTCHCSIRDYALDSITKYQLTGNKLSVTNLYQAATSQLRKAYLETYSRYKDYEATLQLKDTVINYKAVVNLLETELSKYAVLFLSSGAYQHI